MFYNRQNRELQEKYIESLKIIGSLSNLFSDSKVPYLYYRIAEKVFCQTFDTLDLSRGDIALDASTAEVGIGLKTFLKNNNQTLQKVAEFNKDRYLYEYKSDREIVESISYLRNERIEFAQRLSNVEDSIYHCVVRAEQRFFIHEEKMDMVAIENIVDVKRKKNSIWFNDGLHEYTFNLSKSTLLKRFGIDNYLHEFEVNILKNPLEHIKECFYERDILSDMASGIVQTIYLPLYGKDKIVSQRSGLNQWNAKGRQRDANEIYIPIPAKIHHFEPTFFPKRDVSFSLHLPNGKTLNTKVCQDNSKALMSNPNKELGKWLLRDVLKLKEGELLTYEKLQVLGVDSVRIDKIDNENYKISFAFLDSYEAYMENREIANI